jgi:hypothetical protein
MYAQVHRCTAVEPADGEIDGNQIRWIINDRGREGNLHGKVGAPLEHLDRRFASVLSSQAR